MYHIYFGRKYYLEYNLILSRVRFRTLSNIRYIRDVQFFNGLAHGAIVSPTLLYT